MIHLNNGGWYSKTTKERIHSYIKDFGYKLYQKNYQWFIEYPHGEKVEYFNHMTLEPISEKLKSSIRRYEGIMENLSYKIKFFSMVSIF